MFFSLKDLCLYKAVQHPMEELINPKIQINLPEELQSQFNKIKELFDNFRQDIAFFKESFRTDPKFALFLTKTNPEKKTIVLDDKIVDQQVFSNYYQILSKACFSGDLDLVQYLFKIKPDADVNKTKNHSNNILNSAVQSNKLEVVKYLIETKNIDPNPFEIRTVLFPELPNRALEYAAKQGNLELFKYLEEKTNHTVFAQIVHSFVPFAVFGRNIDLIKYLVEEKKADPNDGDINVFCSVTGHWIDYNTLTCAYKFNKSKELIKYLIEKGADLRQVDRNGKTILHYAAHDGDLDFVKFLVEECHVNPKEVTENDQIDSISILHEAIDSGNLTLVKYLREKGAELSIDNDLNQDILSQTIRKGNFNLVKYLIEEFNLNYKKPLILLEAFESDNLEIVKYLIEDKKILDPEDELDSDDQNLHPPKFILTEKGVVQAPIHSCRFNLSEIILGCKNFSNKIELVKYLIKEYDLNLVTRDSEGNTLLLLAAYDGDIELVKYLIGEWQADFTVKNNKGETILMLSAYSGNIELVETLYNLFIGRELDLNSYIVADDGLTLLHYAAFSGNSDFVESLIDKYFLDPKAVSENGETILHSAARHDNLKLMKYLIEKQKLDPNKQNNFGQSAIYYACCYGHRDVVENILENYIIPNYQPEEICKIFSLCFFYAGEHHSLRKCIKNLAKKHNINLDRNIANSSF